MSEPEYPIPAGKVVATLIGVLRAQGDTELVDLLATAVPSIEATDWDNWNGGTSIYTLFLDVPVEVFAKVETQLTRLESVLESKLNSVIRRTDGHALRSVDIRPVLGADSSSQTGSLPVPADLDRLWEDQTFRLFISHVAVHKVFASDLKRDLRAFGVSAFVAHEDIEPNLDWQREIELALYSMHGLLALLTPEFPSSKWTDQELGFALGRGAFVIPVRLGLDPYGFMGKIQAVRGDLSQPKPLAEAVVRILVKRNETSDLMRGALITALERARSYPASIAASKLLETLTGFTSEQLDKLEVACRDNRQVSEAFGVVARIQGLLNKHRTPAQPEEPF